MIDGTCDERFGGVRDILKAALDSAAQLGASVAISMGDDLVVDLWGGWADAERTIPWGADTVTNVWSTTKTVVSLAALVLVDRAELHLDHPVAHYWPEFGASGKSAITVRQVMAHSAGIPAWDQPVETADLYDWERSTGALARQAPWWEPGSHSGYHSLSYGHLLGEILRRITGLTLKQFVAQELAGPLGADFSIGAPDDIGRVATLVAPPPADFDLTSLGRESVVYRTITGPEIAAEVTSTPEWRAADIGASNGFGNARSVVGLQRVVANGGMGALSESTIDLIFDEQSCSVDLVLGIPIRWGVGYALPHRASFPYIPEGRICFWGGWGGSFVVADLDRQMTFAFVMNKMSSDLLGGPTPSALISAAYRALGVETG